MTPSGPPDRSPSGSLGRVAVVGGGTGRLGRAVVRSLLDAGVAVHVPAHSDKSADDLKAFLGADAGRVRFHRADLSDESSVAKLFAAVEEASGRIDILTNIAGGFAMAPIEQTDLALWRRMFDLNATTAFLCCREAVPRMKARRWGRIVNVGSVPAVSGGAASMTAYAASKAAVVNLTQSLAKELSGSGITVNAIIPTTIDTPENRAAMPAADPGKWLQPDAIAAVIGFLASEAAGIVTGTEVMLGT